MTQLLQEPVYFVSGLNFPVGRLGMIGALAVSTIPLAVGLDAMRQLAFAGSEFTQGALPPEVEVLVLLAMTVVFVGLARVLLKSIERLARQEGRLTMRGS
jgi:ABC-2 type transport system permease protein